MKKDPNYAIKVEQAIAKKYGKETIQHPKKDWTEDKEKQYLNDLKQFYKSVDSSTIDEDQIEGIFISKKLLRRESKRSCPVCNVYSFKSNDDVYMSKFDSCFKCYVKWVENREERWLKGWRPTNENNHKKT